MQNKLLYLSLALLLSATAFFFYHDWKEEKTISKLEEIIVEDNQVLGSIFDHRSVQEIEEDILCKKHCPVDKTLSFTEWKTLGPDHARLVGWDDKTMEKQLAIIGKTFKKLVLEFKNKFRSKATLQYRQKSLQSLIGKLKERNKAEEGLTLKRVADLGGIRLIFTCIDDIEPARKEIEKDYIVIQEDDYFANPKKIGYRAYHMDIAYEDIIAEIQLKTAGMDLWSTWNHDNLYKDKDKVMKLAGKEKLQAFNDYSKKLSDYIYQYELGNPIALPTPPEGISVLWDLADEKAKKVMTPEGIPNLKLLKPPSCIPASS